MAQRDSTKVWLWSACCNILKFFQLMRFSYSQISWETINIQTHSFNKYSLRSLKSYRKCVKDLGENTSIQESGRGRGRDWKALTTEARRVRTVWCTDQGRFFRKKQGFPGSSVIKNLPVNAGNTVWSLIHEDPTCRRATKPRATTKKPTCHSEWSPVP